MCLQTEASWSLIGAVLSIVGTRAYQVYSSAHIGRQMVGPTFVHCLSRVSGWISNTDPVIISGCSSRIYSNSLQAKPGLQAAKVT